MGKSDGWSEKTIENTILNWLAWRGHYCWKVKTTGTWDPRRKVFLKPSPLYRTGVSDIIGIIKPSGRLFAIEVKSKTGKLQDNQREFLREIRDRGGLTLVARSVTEVENFFKEFVD